MNAVEKYKPIPHKMLLGINCKNFSSRLESQFEKMGSVKLTRGKCRIAVAKLIILSRLLGELPYRGVQPMPNEMKKTTTVTIKWREAMKRIIRVFLISKGRYRITLNTTV